MSRDARLRMSAGKAKPGGEGGPLAVIHVHHIQGMIKKLFNTERKKSNDTFFGVGKCWDLTLTPVTSVKLAISPLSPKTMLNFEQIGWK